MAEGSQETQSRRSGGFPIFAVILIALGIVLLLQTTGVLPWEFWSGIWRFWPVVIIAIGINLIFGRRLPWLAGLLIAIVLVIALGVALFLVPVSSAVAVSSMQEDLQGLESAELNIDFGAGELIIDSLPEGSPSLVEATFEKRDAETSVVRAGNSATLDISMRDRDFPFFGGFTKADWRISLSRLPRLSIDLDGGASDIRLDLSSLQVSDLSLDTGAASVEVRMPASAGRVNAKIDAGAADITVIIPEGVAARIDSDVVAGSTSIDESRFPRVGDAYISPDFDTATNRIDLEIEAGASSVTIR
jgi:hypothetical protein